VIPERVRVNGIWFEVHQVPSQMMEPEYGNVRASAGVVELNAACTPPVMALTLIHELTHLVIHFSGHDLGEAEEGLVECVSSGLFAILADNPDLLSLFGGNHGE